MYLTVPGCHIPHPGHVLVAAGRQRPSVPDERRDSHEPVVRQRVRGLPRRDIVTSRSCRRV